MRTIRRHPLERYNVGNGRVKHGMPFRAKGLAILILFCVAGTAPWSRAESDSARSTGFTLVLSGGGARGFSQIGVIKALEEEGLRPDLVVGTSMGAIIASLYATGHTPDQIERLAESVNWNGIFTNSASRRRMFVSQKNEPINYLFELRFNHRMEPVLPNSISHGQAFYDLLAPLLSPAQFRAGSDFDRLPIPLRIVTTDLLSGKQVVLSRGNITEAVRASSGVPLAFSPVEKDGMLLVDGGITANIPASAACEDGKLLVVAIDVTSPLWERSRLEHPVYLMDQVVAISGKNRKDENRKQADLLVIPDIEGFNNTDFNPLSTLIERGYQAMKQSIDTLKELLGSYDPSVRMAKHTPVSLRRTNDPITIREVIVSGNEKTSTAMVHTAAGIKPGDPYDSLQQQRAVSSLYATMLFHNVNIDVDSVSNLRIMLTEKQYWRVRMGLRYDEFHLGEGFLQPAFENLFGRGVLAQAHLQYGLRREKYAVGLQGSYLLSDNFANNAKLQAYLSSERIFTDTTVIAVVGGEPDTTIWHREKSLRKTGVLGLIGMQLGRATLLSSGVHFEFYTVQAGVSSAFQSVWGLKFLPLALLRLTMDTMDKFPFPTSGDKHFLTISGSNRVLGGNADFFKIDGSAKRVFTLWQRHTFSPQFRFAWASSPLPEVEKAYIGGSFPEETHQDMEMYNYIPFLGLPPRAVSGDIMGLLQLRYSFLLTRISYLTFGIDWGRSWEQETFSWKEVPHDFHRSTPAGIGIGFAFQTLIGPIRFDYGKLLRRSGCLALPSDERFYFSIGHDF
ncbi:MAG: patatin-like phospholipase family protein [Chitinispirillaceae bacterium]|nr:patatin-like phospholipase family protein [Chitinispirillaceae bacterium]